MTRRRILELSAGNCSGAAEWCSVVGEFDGFRCRYGMRLAGIEDAEPDGSNGVSGRFNC